MDSTLKWKGLETLALALIFAPDPVTTILGVGLLSYARKKQAEEKQAAQPRRHYFTDFYNCKVKMVRGSSIVYRTATTRDGQLPLTRSTISRLYESRKEWEGFHKTITARRPPPTITRHVPGQPPGFLKTPFVRYQTGLMPRRAQT
jgi:hypothetical protein